MFVVSIGIDNRAEDVGGEIGKEVEGVRVCYQGEGGQ